MSKKDYERAALIVQSADTRDAPAMFAGFCALFAQDNPRFDWVRFKEACKPGTDVKSRRVREHREESEG